MAKGSESEHPGTVLRLVDSSLVLACSDGATVAAAGIAEVVPGSTWAGAVLLHMDDGSPRGVNLIPGAEGDLGPHGDQGRLAYGRVNRQISTPTSPKQIG